MSVAAGTVDRVAWSSHISWLRDHLLPGQHISVLVPTGGGKSYLVMEGLMQLPVIEHSRVLLIDDKGQDKTTRNFGSPIHQYPFDLRTKLRVRDKLPHYRLIVPDWTWSPTGSHSHGVDHARQVVGRALEAFYAEAEDPTDPASAEDAQPSVLIVDETFALTDSHPPSLNLAPMLKKYWRKARYKAVSVIALTQAPLGVPSEFYHQPTHLYLGRILDKRQQERLREISGNSIVIEETVSQLDDYEFLFIGNKGKHMCRVMVA